MKNSYHLAHFDDNAFWASFTGHQLKERTDRDSHLAVLPIHGLADWGLGLPLDIEEIIGSAMLDRASKPFTDSLTILPPWRFSLAPYSHSFFGLDPETAQAALTEIALSFARDRFGARMLFFVTSPWNRELADVAATDLRIQHDLQTFVLNLSAVGLDFHPVQSSSRTDLQRIACHLLGQLPAIPNGTEDTRLPAFRPGQFREPPPLAFDEPLDLAATAGCEILETVADRMTELIADVLAYPALAPRTPAS